MIKMIEDGLMEQIYNTPRLIRDNKLLLIQYSTLIGTYHELDEIGMELLKATQEEILRRMNNEVSNDRNN